MVSGKFSSYEMVSSSRRANVNGHKWDAIANNCDALHKIHPQQLTPKGAVLCTLCILLWVLTCGKRFSDLLLFSSAIFTPQLGEQAFDVAGEGSGSQGSCGSPSGFKVPPKRSRVTLNRVNQ